MSEKIQKYEEQKFIDLYHKRKNFQDEHPEIANMQFIDGEDGVDDMPKSKEKNFEEVGGFETDTDQDS